MAVPCLQAHPDLADQDEKQNEDAQDAPPSYLQGMNGICWVMLTITEDNEEQAFEFLCAITDRLLPGIFVTEDSLGEDTLQRTGLFFSSLVQKHAVQTYAILRNACLPIEVLAYKWLLTLFSDLRMSEGDSGMPFTTLLTAWDVSFLMGIEGVLIIGVALLKVVEPYLVQLAIAEAESRHEPTLEAVLSEMNRCWAGGPFIDIAKSESYNSNFVNVC